MSSRRIVALAVLVWASTLASARAADPIQAIREAMSQANDARNDQFPTKARAALAEAKKRYQALGEFEREKAQEFPSWADSLARDLDGCDANTVRYAVEQKLSQAEGVIGQAKSEPQKDLTKDSSYLELGKVDAILGDPENKKFFTEADQVAKWRRKIEWIKSEIPKAQSAGWVEKAQYASRQIESVLSNQTWDKSYNEGGETLFKQADELLARCLADDQDAKALKAKLGEQRKAFAARVGQFGVDSVLKPALELWGKLESASPDDQQVRTRRKGSRGGGKVDWKGWEGEARPTLASLLATLRDEDEKIHKGTPYWPGEADHVLPEAESLLGNVVQPWLQADTVKLALAQYPNDPELKKVNDGATTLREKAGASVCAAVNAVLAEAEKLGPGKDRERIEEWLGGYGKRTLPEIVEGCSAAGATTSRVEALVARWKGEQNKAASDREAFLAKCAAASDGAWPAILDSWASKTRPLDAAAALQKIDAWKGVAVALEPGGQWARADYWCVGESDGIPVCGSVDPDLEKLVHDACARVGRDEFEMDLVVGVIDGLCVARERRRDGRGNWYDGDSRDGVRVRVVAVKTKYFAVSVGQGSSLDAVKDAPPSGVSSSSPGGGGVVHFVHRLVAWVMCALLALAGGLALAHGAGRFVPQIQEQTSKLGDRLGYAGVAVAVLGALWFVAAIALSFVSDEVRFGSAPSVALALAGVAVALDLLRAKGKVKPETSAMIQPAALLFGLGCFGAAAVHFLFWNLPLL